ncbi:SPOR domain-containing protein [Magnetospirillum aberrantis]|uniref:SPOR domain-containing protein n=1 Tax=Magnetospirillum aberrantis SpK TaxID=908842 RepID=A0A7C9QW04_9PROT|nr:SPOR domain-containing protein [Magnetospirillum aberrantis]NFV81980.1 SPOR domain-containing protein [Magnetospirillum aberrantis SpK]
MPFVPRKVLVMALLPVLVGCQRMQLGLEAMGSDLDKAQARVEGRRYVPPGLNQFYGDAPMPPAADTPMEPPPPPPTEYVPFPEGRLAPEQAEILLAGDPMALRFLTLKALAQRGLLPVEEAGRRKDANLAALLPLSVSQPAAAGLEAPIPPLRQMVDKFQRLHTGPQSAALMREAERAFLADALLPERPTRRQPYSPPDIVSARKLQDRLGRLEDSGLITPEQRAGETAAIDKLVAGGTLPQELLPPPPPAPPKPKPVTAKGRGNRMPGGVSGRLEIIPSPPGVEAPKLAAGATVPAGIHLLSMGSAGHGDKAWEALVKEHPELTGLGHTVSRADLGELGVTYRLIAGPMEPAKAEVLCAALKTRGQSCTPTPFPAAP